MDKREFLQHYMVARAGTVSNTSVTQDFGYALDAWCAIEAGCKDDAEPKPKPLDYVHPPAVFNHPPVGQPVTSLQTIGADDEAALQEYSVYLAEDREFFFAGIAHGRNTHACCVNCVHKYSLPAPCSPCDDCSEFKAEPTC